VLIDGNTYFGGKTIADISLGIFQMQVLTTDGSLYRCGDNTYNQFFDGAAVATKTSFIDVTASYKPMFGTANETITAVYSNQYHSTLETDMGK
jgi:alpha-tubulin suppressor-like RCC1 family protein